MTIRWTPEGKVDRTVLLTIDAKALADALDECVAALRVCPWALRQPINDWKGECERKALDAARDALRKIGVEP